MWKAKVARARRTRSESTSGTVRCSGPRVNKAKLVDDGRGGRNCVGCDIVQADHAPDGGVAQGVIHGVVVRHHGRNQEEVEEELKKEVERGKEEDRSNNHAHDYDHG